MISIISNNVGIDCKLGVVIKKNKIKKSYPLACISGWLEEKFNKIQGM